MLCKLRNGTHFSGIGQVVDAHRKLESAMVIIRFQVDFEINSRECVLHMVENCVDSKGKHNLGSLKNARVVTRLLMSYIV